MGAEVWGVQSPQHPPAPGWERGMAGHPCFLCDLSATPFQFFVRLFSELPTDCTLSSFFIIKCFFSFFRCSSSLRKVISVSRCSTCLLLVAAVSFPKHEFLSSFIIPYPLPAIPVTLILGTLSFSFVNLPSWPHWIAQLVRELFLIHQACCSIFIQEDHIRESTNDV